MTQLRDKVALVTGAGRGIGRAIAIAFASEGAVVGLVSRTAAELHETAEALRLSSSECRTYPADVADFAAMESVVEDLVAGYGRIDILVNNAGMQGPIGPLVGNHSEDWLRCIHVNLFGTFVCMKAVLPHMMRRRAGKIINLSGGGATAPRPNFSAYAASKAAVVRLSETVACEVAPYGIQVNCIAPGAVNTRMLAEVLQSGELAGAEAEEARNRQSRGGVPPALAARLATFLASDASGAVTGKLISALHDGWQDWDEKKLSELAAHPWLTLRRMDEHTLKPLLERSGR